MEMEAETETEIGMGLEVQLKKEHKVETQEEDEATKKRKIELDPEERKRLAEAEGVAKFKWLNEVDDEEELTDYYAYQAKQFRRFWESLYLGRYGYFEDESEFLIAPSLLCSHG